jgi:hypothetical protein
MSDKKNPNILELEIATASVKVHCDECNKEMGSQYGKMPKEAVAAYFRKNEEDDHESSHHFCSKACAVSAMSK